MADATQIPNPPKPAGGFQQGAWYQGRQAWQDSSGSWTFSNPGQENPLSSSPTAGKTVSAEVNKQSSIAQTGKATSIQDYFDNYGKVIQKNLQGVDLTSAGSDATVGGIINSARPTPPNLTATYSSLSSAYGVNDLMKNLNDLNAKKRTIQQSVVNAASDTEAQPGVTADVVAGRESEQQRQADKQIAQVDLEIQATSDQLNTANGMISMIMQFTEQDYTNAAGAYDTQFSQAIQYQQLLNSEASVQFQRASANWSTVVGLIQSGAIDANNLTPSQKAQINQFEVAAGLPSGITGNIASNPTIKAVTPMKDGLNAMVQYNNGNTTIQPLSNFGYQPPSIWTQIGNWLGFSGGSKPTASGYTIKGVK